MIQSDTSTVGRPWIFFISSDGRVLRAVDTLQSDPFIHDDPSPTGFMFSPSGLVYTVGHIHRVAIGCGFNRLLYRLSRGMPADEWIRGVWRINGDIMVRGATIIDLDVVGCFNAPVIGSENMDFVSPGV